MLEKYGFNDLLIVHSINFIIPKIFMITDSIYFERQYFLGL